MKGMVVKTLAGTRSIETESSSALSKSQKWTEDKLKTSIMIQDMQF